MIINKIQQSCIHFVANKPFGSLLEISATNPIFFKNIQLKVSSH